MFRRSLCTCLPLRRTVEYVDHPVKKEIDSIQQKEDCVINKWDTDDFGNASHISRQSVISHHQHNETYGTPAFCPCVEAETVHLREDDHCPESKSEHWPESIAL